MTYLYHTLRKWQRMLLNGWTFQTSCKRLSSTSKEACPQEHKHQQSMKAFFWEGQLGEFSKVTGQSCKSSGKHCYMNPTYSPVWKSSRESFLSAYFWFETFSGMVVFNLVWVGDQSQAWIRFVVDWMMDKPASRVLPRLNMQLTKGFEEM